MDDGFQHLGLSAISTSSWWMGNPVGNGLVLPAGPLREPVSGADAPDVVWLYGQEQERLPRRLRPFWRQTRSVRRG